MNLNILTKTNLSYQPSSRLLGFANLVILAIVFFAGARVQAQIDLRLEMSKQSYILNEPVIATLYITNHAGKELVFRGNNARPWLNFHLVSNGKAIQTRRYPGGTNRISQHQHQFYLLAWSYGKLHLYCYSEYAWTNS